MYHVNRRKFVEKWDDWWDQRANTQPSIAQILSVLNPTQLKTQFKFRKKNEI